MSTTAALLPETAPFSPDQIRSLNAAFGTATREQRTWLAGFLAGVDVGAGTAPQMPIAPAAAPQVKTQLTLLYASESGNAEGFAAAAKKVAAKQGFDARVVDMADVDLSVLETAKNVVIYAATWGVGDPPERAQDFYAALMSDAAPRLEHLKFAVLGLGDSAYVDFCETGKRIDARLEALGAKRASPRIDLDLDFAKAAKAWTADALDALKPADAEGSTVVHVAFPQAGEIGEFEDGYTEDAPLEAGIIERVNLNGTGSTRETWHVELATDVPGFRYLPGDSIGVVPQNDPDVVAQVMEAAGVADDAQLRAHLTTKADITTLSVPLMAKYATLTGREDVTRLADDRDAARSFIADRQIV
ncbi:MAG: flavodoxin domain-containing protein, partial [Pseudomonadota bacterium]